MLHKTTRDIARMHKDYPQQAHFPVSRDEKTNNYILEGKRKKPKDTSMCRYLLYKWRNEGEEKRSST